MIDAILRVEAYLDRIAIHNAGAGSPKYGDQIHGLDDYTLLRSDLDTIVGGLRAEYGYYEAKGDRPYEEGWDHVFETGDYILPESAGEKPVVRYVTPWLGYEEGEQ